MAVDPYAMAGIPNPQQQMQMQMTLQEQALPTNADMQSQAVAGVAQQNADLVRWQLDQEDVIVRIENMLRGNVWTGRGWEKKGKQLMNNEGIATFVTQLSGFCHKGVVTSFYKKEEIDARMKAIHRTVTDLIYLHWEDFEINPNDGKLIWDIVVMGQIEPTFRRSTDGKYLQFLGVIQKRIETVQNSQNPKQSNGLFGWLRHK